MAEYPISNGPLDGFGLNDPGRERSPVVSWWDAMHPDRPAALGWKARIQRTRTLDEAIVRMQDWLVAPTAPTVSEDDAENE